MAEPDKEETSASADRRGGTAPRPYPPHEPEVLTFNISYSSARQSAARAVDDARNSDGEIPTCLLKTRVKYEGSLNPTAAAASATDMFGFASSRFASETRWLAT